LKRFGVALLLGGTLWAQTSPRAPNSAEILFLRSSSAEAFRQSGEELRRSPNDPDALLVHMESARLQLRTSDELHSAIRLLETIGDGDPRARIAAERLRELAANTPEFRSMIPNLSNLLRENIRCSREITEALLAASADGVTIPRGTHLTRRLSHWQVVGPFGEFANVDFDRSWPPEQDQLRSDGYGGRVRESVVADAGELELPKYFSKSGVYYAASTLTTSTSRKYRFTIEGEGTFALWLDGNRLLLHDARFQTQKRLSVIDTPLGTGEHRLVLKLQGAALPIRIWLEPVRNPSLPTAKVPEMEATYLGAANVMLDDDPVAALSLIVDPGSMGQMLRAEIFSQLDEGQKQRETLLAAIKADPSNVLAAFRLAQLAFAEERFEEATTYLAKAGQPATAYWPAQELKYRLAARFGWKKERAEALTQRLRLHPNCAAYLDAARLHQGDSRIYELKLSTCSLRPYQYWDRLSEQGDHKRAFAAASNYLHWHPADRRALETAIREAVLANKKAAAAKYAESLSHVSPNWERAGALATHPESILDSPSAYPPADDFYQPYRRDAIPMMAGRSDASIDSRILIHDRVVKLEPGGSAWLYQHTVTQVFTKNGIDRVGEVELPRSADLLELRTVKADGSLVEPELSNGRSTISMRSLAAGDAVEVAYLQHFRSDRLRSNPQLLDFLMGSSDSPTVSSRLVIIRDGAPAPQLWASSQVQHVSSETRGATETTVWEAANMPALLQEPASPHYERRARVLCLGIDAARSAETLNQYRDELIEATKVTPNLEQVKTGIQGFSDRERIAAAYQYVISSIEDANQTWQDGNITSATDAFEAGEGNRAAALIALLSAMGLDADLALAAEADSYDAQEGCKALRCYTHELVRVTLPKSKEIMLLDPEINGIAAGALSPEVEGQPAVLISRLGDRNGDIAEVPRVTDEHSLATASLQLDENGSIGGTIRIRFGSLRGAQMRENLRQLSAKDRQPYFEQIAGRILSRAGAVSASLFHENDPESPLELELKTGKSSAPRWNGSNLEIGQLIPALGLSRLYATLPERQEGLLLETPLIEDSEFIVHLPRGVEPSRLPETANLKSHFGSYHTEFKFEDGALRIVRSFSIPVQQIAPAEYPEFCRFALQIDTAERELIELRRASLAQSAAEASAGVH